VRNTLLLVTERVDGVDSLAHDLPPQLSKVTHDVEAVIVPLDPDRTPAMSDRHHRTTPTATLRH
jgi:hypothetical protein